MKKVKKVKYGISHCGLFPVCGLQNGPVYGVN
jgi:hypothetical protein